MEISNMLEISVDIPDIFAAGAALLGISVNLNCQNIIVHYFCDTSKFLQVQVDP